MRREPENKIYNEISGLLLLGFGTFLFLALISYDARDVPAWFPLATGSATNHSVHNFAGLVGALLASVFYFSFGAGSFFIAVALFGMGAAKLMDPNWPLLRRLPWVILFVAAGSCLLQIQHQVLQGWPQVMKVRGPGGELGYWLGTRFLRPVLGKYLSFLLLLGVYVASLFLTLGIHPATLVRKMREQILAWVEAYHARRMELANARDFAEHEQKKAEETLPKPAKAPASPRRSAKAAAAQGSSAEPGEDAPIFDPNRPAPQVIDSAVVQNSRKTPLPKPENAAQSLSLQSPEGMEDYVLPDVDLLDEINPDDRGAADPEELLLMQGTVIDTLSQFGIAVAPGDITRGPTITRYEVYPAKGVRVDKIVSLERNLARATCAERINILAPIPGKDTVGIEIANSRKQKVTFRDLLDSEDWHNTKAKIPLVLGKDVYGKAILGDLAIMPHLLVAGTTGSGKSVCINAIIASILYRFTPEELRFIMIDPKVVEMQVYNTLPHLVIPVVTDPKKVLLALRWVIDEMEKRYKIFAKTGVRNIATFNARPKPKSQKELDAEQEALDAAADAEAEAEETAARNAQAVNSRAAEWHPVIVPFHHGTDAPPSFADVPESTKPPAIRLDVNGGEGRPPWESQSGDNDPLFEEDDEAEAIAAPKPIRVRRDDDIDIPEGKMPYIVVIVDELADLMQTAPADVEAAIARITQMARAAGIHMIVATQTPRADVITGVIKANIPTRIAFQVASGLDSRIILDEKGAERLLGQGDMLYQPPGASRMTRAQGVLVTDDEIRRIVEFTTKQGTPAFERDIHERLSGDGNAPEELSEEDEELVQKCIEIMRQERKASTSLFQRRLRLGYTRAARVVDILEQRKYVAPGDGAKPREILVDLDDLI